MRRPLLLPAVLILVCATTHLAAPAHARLLCAKIDKSSGNVKDGSVIKLREVCKTKKDGTPIEIAIGSTQDLECGNGIVDAVEDCDFNWENLAVDLAGESCTSRGFEAGTLRCLACSFDESECHRCGNGLIDDASEQCDGPDLAGEDCTSVPGGFSFGDLACTATCAFDLSDCNTCGNGTIEPSTEDCDLADLGGNDCTTIPGGFVSGSLQCNADCQFDPSGCSSVQMCEDRLEQWICGETGPGLDLCPLCLVNAGVIADCSAAFSPDCSPASLSACASAIRASGCTSDCDCE